MAITITRVKKYNANYNHVVAVDGKPVAITKSMNRASMIMAYLQGYKVDLNDNRLLNDIKGYVEKVDNETR